MDVFEIKRVYGSPLSFYGGFRYPISVIGGFTDPNPFLAQVYPNRRKH
jgi:hypothetical protein